MRGPTSSLEVQFAGCRVVSESCTAPPGTEITIWASAAPPWVIEIAVPPGWTQPQPEAAPDGQRFRLSVGERDGTIYVSARSREEHLSWSLAVEIARPPLWLLEDRKLEDDQAPSELRYVLLESALEHHAEDEGRIRSRLARLVKKMGDIRRAKDELRRAIPLHRRAGRVGDEVKDLVMLQNLHIKAGAFDHARTIVEALPRATDRWPADARVLALYMRALQAEKTVDPGRSAAFADQARQLAERTGLDVLALTAAQLWARQLRRLGEHDLASAIFDTLEARLEANPLDCADHAAMLNNIAWDRLLARDLGLSDQDPVPLLERSRDKRDQCGLPDSGSLYGLAINFALAAVQTGDAETTRLHLAQADALPGDMTHTDRLWHAIVSARLALLEGDPGGAHRHCDAFEASAAQTLGDGDEAQLGVAALRARAFLAQGKEQRAIETLLAAQAVLDQLAIGFAPEPSMTNFVALGEPATHLLVETLIEHGRHDEAFATILHSRARRYRALDTGDCLATLDTASRRAFDQALSRFQRNREEHNHELENLTRVPRAQRDTTRARLHREARDIKADFEVAARKHLGACSPSPRPTGRPVVRAGELILAIHPLRHGWAVVAADSDHVDARRIGPLRPGMAPATLARHLLVPFAERIRRADQVRILPYGFLNAIDIHALPFDGDVLLASVPVIYGYALPARVRTGPIEPSMLIIGDPRNNLPNAVAEAREAEALHREAGIDVTILLREQATRAAFLDRLGSYDRLHFAGHSEVTDFGESTLLLSGRDTASSADLLRAPGVPRHVVLLACDSATEQGPRSIASLFLIHGAQTVVASSRQLRDADAARFSSVFYRALASGAPEPEAVQQAQLTLRAEHPDADWASLRILSRQPPPN